MSNILRTVLITLGILIPFLTIISLALNYSTLIQSMSALNDVGGEVAAQAKLRHHPAFLGLLSSALNQFAIAAICLAAAHSIKPFGGSHG